MSTDVVLSDRAVPQPIERPLGDRLGRMFHALQGGTVLDADYAPSPSTVLSLRARCAKLDSWLKPASERELRKHVGTVLGILPTRAGSAADAGYTMSAYATALGGLPLFAVAGACAAALTSGIGDRRFAPTPPELRDAATDLSQPLRVESRRIAAVLNATIAPARSSPERRRELAAAARRAFHIPEGGLPETPVACPSSADESSSLAAAARRVQADAQPRGSAQPPTTSQSDAVAAA